MLKVRKVKKKKKDLNILYKISQNWMFHKNLLDLS